MAMSTASGWSKFSSERGEVLVVVVLLKVNDAVTQRVEDVPRDGGLARPRSTPDPDEERLHAAPAGAAARAAAAKRRTIAPAGSIASIAATLFPACQ